MFENGLYKKTVAAGLAIFLGGCGTPLKNNGPTVQNLEKSKQPSVPFDPARCGRFAVELETGKNVSVYDQSGHEYILRNRDDFTPKENPPEQKSDNTVQVYHEYEDNEGKDYNRDYVYNYGEVAIRYSSTDAIKVAVEKMEDPKIVGATGYACG